MAKEIYTSELEKRMQAGETFTIIDVRELEEWEDGHLEAAKLIPLSAFNERLHEIDFEQDEPVYFICRSGARSGRVCDYLETMGYNVVNVQGGMLGWQGEQKTGL